MMQALVVQVADTLVTVLATAVTISYIRISKEPVFGLLFQFLVELTDTATTHYSDTLNSEISQNSDNFFAPTKMSLFWDYFMEKIYKFSLKIQPKITHFLLFLKNWVMRD